MRKYLLFGLLIFFSGLPADFWAMGRKPKRRPPPQPPPTLLEDKEPQPKKEKEQVTKPEIKPVEVVPIPESESTLRVPMEYRAEDWDGHKTYIKHIVIDEYQFVKDYLREGDILGFFKIKGKVKYLGTVSLSGCTLDFEVYEHTGEKIIRVSAPVIQDIEPGGSFNFVAEGVLEKEKFLQIKGFRLVNFSVVTK